MSSEVILSVSGMTCGACLASITEALNAVDGVSQASVSLITEEAKVVFDKLKVNPDKLIQAIEDCGFDAKLIKTHDLSANFHKPAATINTVVGIEGMTCGACLASITEALENLPGVNQVSISLLTSNGSIVHSSSVSTAQLKQAIEDCGFDATIESSKSIENSKPVKFSTSLAVQGMTCGACLASITEAVEKLSGVSEVTVSLITEVALIEHDDTITPDQLKQAIEDCGFDASITSSHPVAHEGTAEDNDEEEVSLQIFGINDSTDITNLQYNIEAKLNSLPGVIHFSLAFKNGTNQVTSSPILTDPNSSGIQALLSNDNQEIHEDENLIDELTVVYNNNQLGIRTLVDTLNGITNEILFLIVNSVDQSATSQLKLLSRVKDIKYWRNNLIKCLIFGIPVIVLTHTESTKLWKNMMIFPGFYVVTLIELLLTTHIQFNLGSVFLKKFLQFVKLGGRNATMDVLVCISTMISYLFSIFSIVLSVWSGQTKKPPKVLFDTSTMLITFISIGKWLENQAKGATSTALSKLLSLTPTSCTIIEDPDRYQTFLKSANYLQESKSEESNNSMIDLPTRTIGIDLIQPDDIAVVLPGGKIPADGKILFGESEIDESIITGESLPVFKKVGDAVIGGSINGPDLIHVQVLKSGKKSQLQQIINLVKDSQVSKAPIQRFADYVAARFVPAVLVLATLTFIFWLALCYVLHVKTLPMPFIKEENGKFFVCLRLAISVIVVACPCALGLAAPTAMMVGTGVGASHGVLIKGGEVLEKTNKINVILFDKTGTLTTGNMKIMRYRQILNSGLSSEDWWNLCGSVEVNSEHPIGKAITEKAKQELFFKFNDDKFQTMMSDFKVLTGLGIKSYVQLFTDTSKKYKVFVGNNRMINEMFPHLKSTLSEYLAGDLDNLINTLAHVIINDEYSGYFELSDDIKPHTREVLNYLANHENYIVGLVTGDHAAAALKVGKQLGISSENIFSEVSPVNKDKIIVDIKKKFGGEDGTNVGVAFVGDGINDAPALAQADIGMAISSGTDIAIESADIVLINNNVGSSDATDLFGVPIAFSISNATFNRIKLNFIWAAIYNIVMLPFAMGCFLPLNIMLPPIAAGASMALSSVSVVINSLMLKYWKPPKFDAEYDEEEVGFELNDGFSLKTSTLAEFNSLKRNKKLLKTRGVLTGLKLLNKKRKIKLRSNDGNYELISNNTI